MTKRKLFYLWLLLLVMTGSHAFGQSNVSITRNGITVRDALYELEKQTGYSVGFDEESLDAERKVNISIRNEKIENALAAILSGTNCTYTIKNKHVIISKAQPVVVQQTDRLLKGQVKDKHGEPLIGSSVVIDGKATGTTTDIEGNFSLPIESNKDLLVISYLGYVSQRVTVGERNFLAITLHEDSKVLDEVVVVGYNTIRRKDLTTAVSIVSTEDIAERPIISAAQALQGKAAGVQVVQPSGEPGGGLSIRVRGATSLEAGSEPLYVVDGIPMETIMSLNPNDIESMQVLKDASSAAIYGARAANGVVLITTKRGQADAKTISLNTYVGFSKLGNKIKALNTEQYKEYIKDLNKHGGTNYIIPDEETRYTDWSDEFFGTGVNQNYQLSFSSGTENIKYYFSLGYVSDQGIVKKAEYDRYNFRANIDNKITDWLNVQFNLGYSKSKGNYISHNRSSMRAGSILSVVNTPPYMQVWDKNNPGQYDEFAYGSRILNPIAATAADNIYKESMLTGSLNLDFAITKQLHYKIHFGIDETNGSSHYYLDPLSTSDGRSSKGRVDDSTNKNFEWLWENLVSYENTFMKNHNVSLLGGATLQRAKAEYLLAGGYDMLGNLSYLNGANIIDKHAVSSGVTEWTLASFLGRVAYDYKSKYLFSANVRADGSSKFTPGHKWGVFPSMSAAWRISSEPFMKSLSNVISDLKVRVGWGLNGNQGGISNYAWMASYILERVEPEQGSEVTLPGMGVKPSSPGNRELTWETTSQYNAGIDLSMFDSRLMLTADAYYKKTKDMLITTWLPSMVNLPGGIQRNDGEMENKGMEFGVSSKNFVSDFKWNTDFNISFNRNKLTKIGLTPVSFWAKTYGTAQPGIILKENLALGSFYGYIAEGIDPETGDVIYKDLNENEMIDPEDRTIIGNAQPDFIFGLTNTFSYAGFDLTVFFQGSYGNDIFNYSKMDMTGMMDFRNQSTDVLRRWQRPGMITDIPRPGNIENMHNSTRFVEDGSYLRLKSITLAYNFDTKKTFFRRLGISKLQPYITGQNLWTWTDYSGYDPEVNAYGGNAIQMGVDYGTYPQSKTVIFGVNVQF